MKVTPQVYADFDDYPELRQVVVHAIGRVAELMQLHGLAELRRVHKHGVYGRPYDKDVAVPIQGITPPDSVVASRKAAGKALLDYLEAVGVSGVSVTLAPDELAAMTAPAERQCPVQRQNDAPGGNESQETGTVGADGDGGGQKPDEPAGNRVKTPRKRTANDRG